MKTAIFLGAGASKSEGAPLQGELFKQYFSMVKTDTKFTEMKRELNNFFKEIFFINTDLNNDGFPTFEEVLGVIEQAIARNETLKNYELDNISSNINKLRKTRLNIILSMAYIIHENLKTYNKLHELMCKKLSKFFLIKDVLFLTTNYDILIDNALMKLLDTRYNLSVDYGIELTNFNNPYDWRRPTPNSVLLLKLHGSLNWLFCPACNTVTLTPKEKGVVTRLLYGMYDSEKSKCPDCENTYVPLIIPPSFFKDMSNYYIGTIWNKAEQELRKVEHIIFCGYSFPDADIHIKYLLKRIQTNRKTPVRFTVINNHTQKSKGERINERLRFKRFLGPNTCYTDLSFEDFVNDPVPIFNDYHRLSQSQ